LINRDMPKTRTKSRHHFKFSKMKKILLGVFAILLAAATVFTTQANKPVTATDDPVYHWFEGEDYIGEATKLQMSVFCNEGSTVCLEAFDPSVGTTRPSSIPLDQLNKN
jgi:hypothetical protein